MHIHGHAQRFSTGNQTRANPLSGTLISTSLTALAPSPVPLSSPLVFFFFVELRASLILVFLSCPCFFLKILCPNEIYKLVLTFPLLFCYVSQALGQIHSPPPDILLVFHFVHTLRLLTPLGNAPPCAFPPS